MDVSVARQCESRIFSFRRLNAFIRIQHGIRLQWTFNHNFDEEAFKENSKVPSNCILLRSLKS